MQEFRFSSPSLNQGTALYDRIGGGERLALLLRHFYADVRQHRVLAPIFNAQVKEWTEHLVTIAEFWARVTGGPSDYSGQMPRKHLHLGLTASHFEAWLQLWEVNCRVWLNPAAAEEMIGLARDIARRLRERTGASETVPGPLA